MAKNSTMNSPTIKKLKTTMNSTQSDSVLHSEQSRPSSGSDFELGVGEWVGISQGQGFTDRRRRAGIVMGIRTQENTWNRNLHPVLHFLGLRLSK